MILTTLALLAAQQAPLPPDVIERSDDAGALFLSCLFAESRKANTAQTEVETFRAELEGACKEEEAEMRAAMTEILTLRKRDDPAGRAHRYIVESREVVVETYADGR